MSKLFEMAVEEAEGQPMRWWWLSFADADRPAGQQFLGVAIVQAQGFGLAVMATHLLKINPGGSVQGNFCPDDMGEPPAAMRNRLTSDKAELDRLTREWTGAGVMSTGEAEAKGLL